MDSHDRDAAAVIAGLGGFKVGDRVKIVDGWLQGVEGVVKQVFPLDHPGTLGFLAEDIVEVSYAMLPDYLGEGRTETSRLRCSSLILL